MESGGTWVITNWGQVRLRLTEETQRSLTEGECEKNTKNKSTYKKQDWARPKLRKKRTEVM